MSLIVYKNEDNSIGAIYSSEEALNFSTIEQIAEKVVPYGLAYKICAVDDIPSDRSQREAWEWDSSIEPDGFGGESNEFDAELLAKYRGEA